ncbi:hypothetical protein K501DRAFT_279193 [Backusella circina FSU 941]|nr:hypothetical protein K501DRAFT_279193 [Backusella circina FSU 941]
MLKNPERVDFYDIKTLLARLKKDAIPVTPSVIEGAASGDISAYLVLGEKYSELKEYKKAISWLMLGAWKNHPQCMVMIGYFYENGIYVTKDMDKAMDWYIKSVSKNAHQSMYHLDKLCKEGFYSKLITKILKELAQRVERDKQRIKEFNMFMHWRTIEVRNRAGRLNELIGGSMANVNLIKKKFKDEEIELHIKEQEQIIEGYNHLMDQKDRVNFDTNQIVLFESIIQTLSDFVYIRN